MKYKTSIALLFALALLSGCANVNVDKYVPDITAQRIEYHRTGTVSGADVTVVNIQQFPDKVTADQIEISVRYPFIGSVSVTATGYVREKEPTK